VSVNISLQEAKKERKKKSYSMNILTHSDEFVGLKKQQKKLMKV